MSDDAEFLGWYKKVPKGIVENLRWRRFVLTAAKSCPKNQAALRLACAKDVLFYYNTFVWTYDPRLKSKAVPFITYPYQDEGIQEIRSCIIDGAPLLMQKSRDMGASWMSLGTMDHFAQNEKGAKFLMMSRIESLVDEPGEPDCLFWKIDFIHKHLPSWLRPRVNRRKLRIEYLATDATVTGCSTTGAAGVGGRATGIFIDEFSRFEPRDAKLVMAGIADTSPCRIFNFTPFGMAHPSFDLVRQAEKGDIRCLRMHWTAHPEKARGHYTFDPKTQRLQAIDTTYQFPLNYPFQRDGKFFHHSPWFDKERRDRADDRAISEMLEIDYEGASALFFDAGTVRDLAMEFARKPDHEGDLNYDIATGIPREFVEVKGGQVKLWRTLDRHGKFPPGLYVAGCDISTGQGASNSCICIANLETGEKVLEFATPTMLPEDFAVKCVAICWWVSQKKDLKLVWECPGPGASFGKKVLSLNYGPVFWRKNEMSISQKQTDTPGWFSTTTNKRVLLEQYREALGNRSYINRSEPAFRELKDWEITASGIKHMGDKRKAIDPTGASMNHGDRTIADALCWKLIKESGVERNAFREKVLPGSIAWFLEEEERDARTGELYPNWRGRHG